MTIMPFNTYANKFNMITNFKLKFFNHIYMYIFKKNKNLHKK